MPLYGQQAIVLNNPSFEDFPKANKQPIGWFDCGTSYFPQESPPDVQPSPNPDDTFFGVTTPSYDGQTYLGMVARGNDSWEFVSQRLSKPLAAGKCYAFSIYLCHSETYISGLRGNPTDINFTQPIKLRIWGGNGYCDKGKLLAESPLISNTDWKEYAFKFQPNAEIKYIVFEAFYKTPTLVPYSGNILLDKASAIVEMPCDESPEPILALNEQRKQPRTKPDMPPVRPAPPKPQPPTVPQPPVATVQPPKPQEQPKPTMPAPQPKKNKIITELDNSSIQQGQVINIDKFYFMADSSRIEKKNYPILDELVDFMVHNPKVVIEIGGHTNNRCESGYCDELSERRAKSVRDYLLSKGVDGRRIEYKGYGSRKPVASNNTPEGRLKNQRVEIKILSTNG